jgi:hypothetical protein
MSKTQAGRRTIAGLLAVAVVIGILLAAPGVEVALAQTPASSSSEQLFNRMFVVFEHPRCMNCHTGEAFPRQGDDRHRHTINVLRGPDDRGAAGLRCGTCHQSTNQIASGVPGAPDWHVAPLRMAWAGLTAGQLCRALRDPALGAMRPDQMVAHFNTGLVRWAWTPGMDSQGRVRVTPSLSHDEFVGLTKLWIASGAACPK